MVEGDSNPGTMMVLFNLLSMYQVSGRPLLDIYTSNHHNNSPGRMTELFLLMRKLRPWEVKWPQFAPARTWWVKEKFHQADILGYEFAHPVTLSLLKPHTTHPEPL